MAKFNIPAIFTNRSSSSDVKYEPIGEKGKRSPCPNCGHHLESIEPRSNSLLIYACVTLALISSVLLGMVIYLARHVSTESTNMQQALVELFGEVPMVDTVFKEDLDFVGTDPHDGSWDHVGSPRSTVWDDIYMGAWISVPHPAQIGMSGGVPLEFFHVDKSAALGSEAYVVSMLHQIHCVGELKHILVEYEKTQKIETLEHGTHCVEYLRQAVMCSADLTLERPAALTNTSFKGSNGWDAVHKCRDWSKVYELLSSHKIY